MQTKYLIYEGVIYSTTDYRLSEKTQRYACRISVGAGTILVVEKYLFNTREEAEDFQASWLAQPLFA